ncbi:hypothetical protein M422DRAFT_232369 [Sphaerobolus stellatus SS14]|uniref:Phytanoyl-CoA dioxygenase n=1 Tax=Sphaerobolus stellatus (strain SS14) TaxID=990650 RepID=A0A0C9V547_SPHS4|nr:hypothetical protein M422DRAFT_232369 [Sphaerobolus stellatus SS14]
MGNTNALTEEQRTHFLEHGWVHLSGAIPEKNIQRYIQDIWIRTGYDPLDSGTWTEERFRMPRHKEMLWKEFAPKGYAAICDILGGEDCLDHTIFNKARDGLIANFGKEEYRDMVIHPKDLENWHIDGNWFTHFLDSSEHSLLVICLFNDVEPRAGGTYICEDGLKPIIQWLHNRPQGCSPKLVDPDGTTALDALQHCEKFIECTGKAGDMFICHGFMPHSASKNHRRIPRFITSPRFVLKDPFNYNRENPEDYSLLELKTLKELGVSSLPDWNITGQRARFKSDNNIERDSRLPLELERLKAHASKTGGIVDSIHVNGIVEYNEWTEAALLRAQ